MAVVIDVNVCEGHGDCIEVCPVEALSLNEDNKAVCDEDLCTDCMACISACPVEAISEGE
ncbi:TPA: ferredoxin [Candidatus Marinimicrobia bacterium]|nr:MAG: CoB--CoM heterodisulfide reductase 1 iron-sulfur subunit A [Marinimicrobia bacterium 46_47]KUK93273.1 MAG: CoB--CoM heterodisulfide reductase 1 iron-sulfur subunit A [Marinimicrobia bacterium 46_43]HAE88050.1 ferredoxin [Candidatus Neomarinimicrobiota bacterium]HBY17963.1 ferredoxin [Candidatus Neomarinimicrobiota bacterium]